MTTSSNTTKREKVTLKKSEVVPSNYHLEEKHYAPMVVIGGETTFGAWCDTKEEAKARLNHLEIAIPLLPRKALKVAESGIKNGDDLNFVADLGYDGVLVGTSLMKTGNPGNALEVLIKGLR